MPPDPRGPDPREMTLPKWAQQRLDSLRRDVEWYKAKVFTIENRETNVWLESVGEFEPLAPHSRVAFTVGQDPRNAQRRYDVRIDGLDLVVSGGDGISIFPMASNVVRVRHDRRR